MSQILTVIVNIDERGVGVSWFESDGMTDALTLAAVQAVERELQHRIARAEVEAERAKAEAAADGRGELADGP